MGAMKAGKEKRRTWGNSTEKCVFNTYFVHSHCCFAVGCLVCSSRERRKREGKKGSASALRRNASNDPSIRRIPREKERDARLATCTS
jgi:hypothetical protein